MAHTLTGNAYLKVVKTEAMVRSSPFVKGFKQVKAGKPWSGDEYTGRDAWRYERGRQFAYIFNGALKDGNRVRREALEALREAFSSKTVL